MSSLSPASPAGQSFNLSGESSSSSPLFLAQKEINWVRFVIFDFHLIFVSHLILKNPDTTTFGVAHMWRKG
jgi:hypothetical protein